MQSLSAQFRCMQILNFWNIRGSYLLKEMTGGVFKTYLSLHMWSLRTDSKNRNSKIPSNNWTSFSSQKTYVSKRHFCLAEGAGNYSGKKRDLKVIWYRFVYLIFSGPCQEWGWADARICNLLPLYLCKLFIQLYLSKFFLTLSLWMCIFAKYFSC